MCACVRPLEAMVIAFLRNIMNSVHRTLYDHAVIVVTYCEIVSTGTGTVPSESLDPLMDSWIFLFDCVQYNSTSKHIKTTGL